MRRGVNSMAVAGLCAALCLVLALGLTALSAASGLAGDGCQGHGAGRSYHQSLSLVPTGTDCDYFVRSTGETSSALVVPWGPITWLVPTLIFSAIAFLTMGVLGRLLHRHEDPGTIPSQGT